MKSLTYQGDYEVAYTDAPDPRLRDSGSVIIKTELTAICGSDLHVYRGHEKGLDRGTVMGHEFLGTVAEVGRDVQDFRVGDRVVSPFYASCGACFYCQHELSCRCEKGRLFGWVENGVGLHGGQAEYVEVPLADTTLYRIPDSLDPEEALLLGDVFPTGFFAASRAQGKSCAILGCGPVGLMAVIGLRELGAERIFSVDVVPERLELAKSFGATPLANNAVEMVKETTQGRGADAVIEAVGSAAAQELALEMIRPGGTIVGVGVNNAGHFAFPPVALYNKNLTYVSGRCPVRNFVPRLIPLLEERKYDVKSIISHRMSLADGVEAYGLFDEKRDGCTKVVLRP